MSVLALFELSPAHGSPAEIMSSPAPAIEADAPKAQDIKDGDTSVATSTGALNYSYPIQVPPGRNGMAPHLALAYSSQAPTYGGIAAGWSLSIPQILEDTSQGRLRTHSPEVEAAQSDPGGDDRFVSTLAGGRRLIRVTEPAPTGAYATYRADGDASFARYVRMASSWPHRWRVYLPDGSTMYFGGQAETIGCQIHDGFAPLTAVVDAFGNEVRYVYESLVSGECRIKRISWGQNPAASISTFAEVVFNWDSFPGSCNGSETGATRSYRTGRLVVSGASRLLSISVNALVPGTTTAVHTRTITLGYSFNDDSCSAPHAPVRLLTSIHETAVGTDSPLVDLPAVTFDYGATTVNLQSALSQAPPWFDAGSPTVRRENMTWGYRFQDSARWPSVEAMILDVDGDGLPDRVFNTSIPQTNGNCQASWQHNQGPVGTNGTVMFSSARPLVTMPHLKWATGTTAAANEGCALNGQITAFNNATYSGDSHCRWKPDGQTGDLCQPATDPLDTKRYCGAGGTVCPTDATDGGGPDPYRTFLAYRWIDMDDDGLVDLVAAPHGSMGHYDLDQGNLVAFKGFPEPAPFGTWPACPAVADRCAQLDSSCELAARTCTVGQFCTYNWSALDSCLAQHSGCFEVIRDPTVGGPPPGGGTLPTTRAPYTRCQGLYPWAIYKNRGNGQFATTAIIKYQPVPLESDLGDSSVIGPGIYSQHHGIVDFDGDGILDAVAEPRTMSGTQRYLWSVWLGDGTGGFGPRRYLFPTRDAPNNRISAIGTTTSANQTSEGLLDINGDGLPDQWLGGSNNAASVAFHDGTLHRLFTNSTGPVGEGQTPTNAKPGSDALQSNYVLNLGFVVTGDQYTTQRAVDVDGDGLVDVVSGISANGAIVHYNDGGGFIGSTVYQGNLDGLRRHVNASQQSGTNTYFWDLTSDLVDLDGDGIPESTYFANGNLTRVRHLTTFGPPRLMTGIHNGRGADTTVAYASMHDSSTVEQHPETVVLENGDSRPKASPHTQWVVKSLSTSDRFANTASTASYYYVSPRHGKDDEGHYAFRGFEEVRTTAPSGAKTIERYAYSPDWSGRLVASLVVPAEAPSDVRSLSRTTWEQRDLFNGTVKTFFPTVVERFTCANGQNEAQCTASGAAPGYTRTTSTLTALASTTVPGGSALLWQETESLLQAGTTSADGDRRTTRAFLLASDAGTYRLRQLAQTKEARSGGTFAMYAKTANTWDATFRVPTTSEVWFDASDANRAVARAEYDMSTGLVTRRYKPKQNAAGTTFTQLTYDARKLFVATEVNEVGHQFDYTYEYGTGTRLTTQGPNTRACTQSCPTDAAHPVKEQHKIRVDGVGREIERWDTTSDDGSIYTLYQMSASSYVDTATSSVPTSVTRQTRLDVNTTLPWKQEKTELDGHGRPTRQIVFAQGTVPADQITSFSYRNDGTLQSVAVPDPTLNNTSTVSYTYSFDSLGRATSMRRPDAIVDTDKSGVDIAYDGTTKTVTEIVGAAGGQPAVSRTITDKLGRLVEVRERVQPTALNLDSTWAITRYSYGPNDLVATVTDPQNVVTTLVHDLVGHRTEIRRPNNRSWKYAYDKNGNLISEQVPGSPSPAQDINYTTTVAYDDLDRPTSKIIGPRDLSAADQQLFGNYTETYSWDVGANHIGFLRFFRTFAPGAQAATVRFDLYNNNQGQPTESIGTHTLAGLPTIERQWLAHYMLFGPVQSTRYRDMFVGDSHETTSTTTYDARGLPLNMTLQRTGEPTQTLAVQTRNVAGLVTKRRSDVTTAMGYVESNWTYDKLGRVASQVVQKGPGTTQVVRQNLAYFGNDDPKTLDHFLGTTQRHFQYGYDLRHQLTSAAETTMPGYFSATYDYGLAGRFTHALEAQTTPLPPGSDVKPRDVNYQYGGTDPEQVTALTKVSDGQPFATYTYDAAGNQKTRCYGAVATPTCAGEATEYVYDGKDQLRRATKKLNGVSQGSDEYWYDGDGQRIAIVKRDGAGNKTELISFNHDTEAHYDGSANLVHTYSHVSFGTPIARVDRTSPSVTTMEYQFHGIASNTLAAVDQGGTVNASFTYAPFGEVINATDGGAPSVGIATHKRRLNDKLEDDTTSLVYFGARYLDKTLIGWTQSDPLFSRAPDAAALSTPRRANLYNFDLNNSLRYVDPDGKDPSVASGPYAPQPMPEDPADIDRRNLRLRMADEDWTIKFNSHGFGVPWSEIPDPFATVDSQGNCLPGKCMNDTVSSEDLRAFRGESGSYHTIFDDAGDDAEEIANEVATFLVVKLLGRLALAADLLDADHSGPFREEFSTKGGEIQPPNTGDLPRPGAPAGGQGRRDRTPPQRQQGPPSDAGGPCQAPGCRQRALFRNPPDAQNPGRAVCRNHFCQDNSDTTNRPGDHVIRDQ